MGSVDGGIGTSLKGDSLERHFVSLAELTRATRRNCVA